jgi:hypothetical protein
MIHNDTMEEGERIGSLITLKRYKAGPGARWSCWCVCGRFASIHESQLLAGRKTCGHCTAAERKLLKRVPGASR